MNSNKFSGLLIGIKMNSRNISLEFFSFGYYGHDLNSRLFKNLWTKLNSFYGGHRGARIFCKAEFEKTSATKIDRQKDLDLKKDELSTIIAESESEESKLQSDRDKAAKKVDERLIKSFTKIRANANKEEENNKTIKVLFEMGLT